MSRIHYDKSGKLHKLGYINKAWRERIFALDKANNAMLYFRTDEQFEQHCAQGAQSQAGTILLKNTVMYVADYMDYPWCIELAVRDIKNVTTRHYFIFASNAMELREWMEAIVEAGAAAAGPVFPMRVIGDSYRKPVASSSADGGASSPKSYGGVDETDPRNIAPFAFPVRLSKYGFLQKRGVVNTSYKTRFCRIEPSPTNAPLLVYYANVETTPRNGEIALTGVTIEDDKSNGDELSFKLTVAGKDSRSFFLRAPSKAQKRKWISILKRVSEGETMATEDPRVAAAAAQAAAEKAAAAAAAPHGRSVAGSAAAGGAAGAAGAAGPTAPVQTRVAADGKVYKKRVVKRAAVNPDLGSSPPEGDAGAGAAHLAAGAAVVVGGAAVAAHAASPGPAGSPANFSESPPAKSTTPNPHAANGDHHANGTAATAAASSSHEEHKHADGPHEDEEEVVDDPAAAAAAGAAGGAAHHARHNSESDSGGAAQWGRPYASGSVGEDGKPTASEIALAFERAGGGSDMFKIPTGSFASVEKKRFYLLDVATHARATKLLAEACAEIKKKDKTKLGYYEGIKSGYLLHWESSKAFAYESFVWLDPKAPRTEWNLFFGQGHGLFTKKKLKPEYNDPAAQRRSFTIVTAKRTFDLIVDSKIEFGYWKTALEHVDGQRK